MLKSKKFWLDCVFATIFIFVLMTIFFNISQLKIFDAFDPIGTALSDFESSDIAFSQIRQPEEIEADTNIVIVNLSAPYIIDRKAFAQQLRVINQYSPKIVALDGFYNFPKADTLGDLLLADALAETKNLVMVTKLIYNQEKDTYDSLERSHAMFRKNAVEAYANLDTDASIQQDFKATRAFPPTKMVNGKKQLAFGVKIAEIYNPEAAKKFLDRDNQWETINYRGNIPDLYQASNFGGKFPFLDWDDVLEDNFDPNMITNKIVIFGYTGENLFDTSWDDKFFTPLNKTYAGRTNPDMYGVVVHANIVSMIINDDPIDKLSSFWDVVLGILICFFNVALFSIIYHRMPKWYDGATKLIQLMELLILVFMIVYVFAEFSFKINLTIGLASVALAGDSLEVYYGVIRNLAENTKKSFKKIKAKAKKK